MPFLEDNPAPEDDAPLQEIVDWNTAANTHTASIGAQITGNAVTLQIMLDAMAAAIGLTEAEWLHRQQIAQKNLLKRMIPKAEQASVQARLLAR